MRLGLQFAMQSRDWDELQRLMSIARQQNLLGEAIQCVEQSPYAPVPRAAAKAKAMAAPEVVLGATGSAGTDGSAGVVIGSMTDASKRRLPEDSDWEPIEGSETMSTAAHFSLLSFFFLCFFFTFPPFPPFHFLDSYHFLPLSVPHFGMNRPTHCLDSTGPVSFRSIGCVFFILCVRLSVLACAHIYFNLYLHT